MKKVVVIGAGFGGIALAIRLQAKGIATVLLEQRDKPGGCAYVYQDKGFQFDAGPTVITAISEIEELFYLSGKEMGNYIEFIPVKPFYRLCWENNTTFNCSNDQKYLEKQIHQFNTNDIHGYRQFLSYSQKAFDEGYFKLKSVPFLSFFDMIRVFPQLVKLQAWRSIYSKVSNYIKNKYLRQAFSFHSLFIGGNPFSVSSMYSLIHILERKWGVWFPRGGTSALVNSMVKLFQDLGGEILFNAQVIKIETCNNVVTGVQLRNNKIIQTRAVVSNADVIYTYDNLLTHHFPSSLKAHVLKNKKISNSLFILYFGLKHNHTQLAHHTIFFGSRYQELIYDIFHHNDLTEDFSLYLHAPCVTDPSLAPPGCGAYYVLSPVPNLGIANLDWRIEGPKLRNRILKYLEKHYISNLRNQLLTCRIFTPLDFKNKLNTFQGSSFSIEPILLQSAWFRPHNKDKHISNLYLVGSGTHPGAGIPGVINSAKVTANLMLEKLT